MGNGDFIILPLYVVGVIVNSTIYEKTYSVAVLRLPYLEILLRRIYVVFVNQMHGVTTLNLNLVHFGHIPFVYFPLLHIIYLHPNITMMNQKRRRRRRRRRLLC